MIEPAGCYWQQNVSVANFDDGAGRDISSATVTDLSHGLEWRYSARARTDYVRGGRLDKTILSVTLLGNFLELLRI